MAKNNWYKNRTNNKNRLYGNYGRNRKSKFTKVEQAAYMCGLVKRGMQNPDSRITESYKRGVAEPKPKAKAKPLF